MKILIKKLSLGYSIFSLTSLFFKIDELLSILLLSRRRFFSALSLSLVFFLFSFFCLGYNLSFLFFSFHFSSFLKAIEIKHEHKTLIGESLKARILDHCIES